MAGGYQLATIPFGVYIALTAIYVIASQANVALAWIKGPWIFLLLGKITSDVLVIVASRRLFSSIFGGLPA
jgi:hypothetical protein